VGGGREHSQASPDYHHRREEISRLDIVEGKIRGDLTDHVAAGEDGVDLREFVSLKMKVFLHSRYVSIGEVATIKLIHISRECIY
jgi:hypothetical protein